MRVLVTKLATIDDIRIPSKGTTWNISHLGNKACCPGIVHVLMLAGEVSLLGCPRKLVNGLVVSKWVHMPNIYIYIYICMHFYK